MLVAFAWAQRHCLQPCHMTVMILQLQMRRAVQLSLLLDAAEMV